MFTFKVAKKRAYDSGVIVIGKILSGTIYYDDDVFVRVGKKDYKAHIDLIKEKYPNGEEVYGCSRGSNVALYLSGIHPDIIKPQITSLYSTGDDTTEDSIAEEKSELVSSSLSSTVRPKEKIQEEKKQKKENLCKQQENKLKETSKSKDIYSVSITSAEKEYIADVTRCLKEKGGISPTELFVLDKIRKTLNLSESKARELLEATLKNYNLEKKLNVYRDAVAACLLDCGYLTSTESFLLERLKIILNIPDSIAYQIEREVSWDDGL